MDRMKTLLRIEDFLLKENEEAKKNNDFVLSDILNHMMDNIDHLICVQRDVEYSEGEKK
jgi:hypothetical protein